MDILLIIIDFTFGTNRCLIILKIKQAKIIRDINQKYKSY